MSERDETLQLRLLEGVAAAGLIGLNRALAEALADGYTEDELRHCMNWLVEMGYVRVVHG